MTGCNTLSRVGRVIIVFGINENNEPQEQNLSNMVGGLRWHATTMDSHEAKSRLDSLKALEVGHATKSIAECLV